jgi:hypothetical protein
MILIADRLQGMLESRLSEAGLAEFYNKEHSQFLDLDGEVFAEVVINDASKLEDVEKVVRLTAEEMKSQGISLDSVVRALWEIVSVDYNGPSYTPDLKEVRAADEFCVVLQSGTRRCRIIVDVSSGAQDILRHQLGLKGASDIREMITPLVRKLLEQRLSQGGTSYWDPLREGSRLVLTATAMSFLLGQSVAFEELRQAISDAFDPPVLESFLAGLSASGIKIHDFDAVLPEFSNMLGGAYRKGESFSTSAGDLFRRLERTEQELLRKYFQGKIDQLKTDPRFAGLPKKFAEVFAPVH